MWNFYAPFIITDKLNSVSERAFHLLRTKEIMLLSLAIAYTGNVKCRPFPTERLWTLDTM